MSTTLNFKPLLAALLLAGFALSAVAGETTQPQTAQSTAQSAPTRSTGPIKPGDRNCIRDTGSLIHAKPGECLPVAGRSYSREDLQGTGHNSLGPALRDLDPSISLGH